MISQLLLIGDVGNVRMHGVADFFIKRIGDGFCIPHYILDGGILIHILAAVGFRVFGFAQ